MHIILIVHHELQYDSGAAGTTLSLAQAYEQAGHTVTLYSFSDLPPHWSVPLKSLLFPAYVYRFLTAQLRTRPVDVIDASTADGWLWGSLRAMRRRRGPLLVTRSHGLEHVAHEVRVHEARMNGTPLSWKYPLYWGGYHLWEVRRSLRQSDLVFVLNEDDAAYTIRHLGLAAERLRVVPNGISAGLLQAAAPPPSCDAAGFGVVMLGSFIERKGIRYAVPALNAFLRAHAEAHVSLLGTGQPVPDVLAHFLPEVRERITVLPRYRNSDLPRLTQGHQVLLFPSLSEGFGKVIVEAMACGLAPVACRIPGPQDIIRPEVNGLLVPPGDVHALLSGLERLRRDRALLAALRQAAHTDAQQYSWPNVARLRLEHYAAFIQQRAAA